MFDSHSKTPRTTRFQTVFFRARAFNAQWRACFRHLTNGFSPSSLPPRLRRARQVLVALGSLGLTSISHAEDWPVYQHDNHRSAKTAEALAPAKLREQWAHRSPQPPRPAWAGPARWDAFRNMPGLPSMRNYDPAFHVIVVGDSIYFGSSADDAVHCLDAKTGKRKWFFATGGPVRIAPAWHNGRLYFGSDDGCAYCVRADDGKLLWRYNPVEDRRLVLNDGRFIPFWPIRTGVVVDGGTAYFGASMLPWKKSYLCAVDAETGRPQGAGRFVKEFEGLTLEGAMLASSTHLLSPQGRVPPLLFKRSDGEKVGGLQGGGGCFVLLTPDEQIYHGPGDRTTTFFASAAKDRTQIASYPRGNLMVVSGNTAYLLADDSLAAINRSDKEKKPIWIVKRRYPYSLIVSGDTLFVGGEDEAAAFSAKDGAPLWKARVEGRAYGLAVANGGLFVATDEGVIHCFREDGGGTESSAKPGSGRRLSRRKPPRTKT